MYDEVYGSLRLTEQLYLEFEHVLSRLSDGLTADLEEKEELASFVARIREEVSAFAGDWVTGEPVADSPTGHEQVFTPGSRVCYRQAGQMASDVKIVRPTMMEGKLMYQVKIVQRPGQQPALRWLAASAIEPSATEDAWNYSWWNRETETYEELPDGEES